MSKTLYMFIFVSIVFSCGSLQAAEDAGLLTIRMKGLWVDIPFRPRTTITQLKQMIADTTGLPMDQLELIKTPWVSSGPQQPHVPNIILEDDKMCVHYQLNTASRVLGRLKKRIVFDELIAEPSISESTL